jgi:hypothetical protein
MIRMRPMFISASYYRSVQRISRGAVVFRLPFGRRNQPPFFIGWLNVLRGEALSGDRGT